MGVIWRVAIALAAALALCGAATAAAAEPRWSLPRDAGVSGAGPSAALDDRGQVSMIWNEWPHAGRVVGAVREAGAARFSAPFEVLPEGWAGVHAAASGDVVVVAIVPACSGGGCRYVLQTRIGPDLRRLGPVQTLAAPAFGVGTAVAPDGRVLLAWPSGLGQGEGGIEVAERQPGSPRFGAPVRLEGGGGTPPRVAMNEQGAAVVAWGRPVPDGEGNFPYAPRVAVRPAGGRFGPVQGTGGPLYTGFQPQVTMASDGTATVAVAGDRPGYRVRPARGGAFGPLVPFTDRAAEVMTTVANPRGAAAAMWIQHIPGTGETRERPHESGWYAAVREPGSPAFGPARRLDLGRSGPAGAGLDAHGNLLLAWADQEQEGRLRAGTLTRFDSAPSELSPPLSGPRAQAGQMVVNSSGHALLPFTEGGESGPIRYIERAADVRPPALVVGPLTISPRRVSVSVRCAKTCRATAHLVSGRRGRASASRAKVIRRGRRASLRTTLSRRTARRLARGRGRIRLEVRAYDAWGNRRVVRRRVSAKRLLARR